MFEKLKKPAKPRSRKGGGEVEKIGTGAAAKYRARYSRIVVKNGVKVRIKPSKTFPSNREAWAWIESQRGVAVVASTQTVAEWLTEWLTLHKSNVTAKSYAGDAHTVKRYLIPGLGPHKLRSLDSLTIIKWLASLKEEGVSDSERKKAGAALRKALNYAKSPGKLIASNPCDEVKLPTPERAEKIIMTALELKATIAAAESLGIGYAVRLWVDAGLRPAEMFALHWSDIDLATGKVKVTRALDGITNEAKETKTAKSRRTIILSRPTVEALQSVAGEGVFLPDSNGKYLWASNFADTFAKIMKLAQLEERGFDRYTFRHTMASLLLSNGVNILVVSRRLGHSKVTQTLDTYSHLMPDDAEKAADVMGAFLPVAP